MKIKKTQLENVITKAVKELRNAGNDESYRVKIYLDGKKLGYQIIKSGCITPNFQYIHSFTYKFPYYNNDSGGSIPYMRESGIENPTDEEVKEWDWGNFTAGDGFRNAVEYHLYECISGIGYRTQHEVI